MSKSDTKSWISIFTIVILAVVTRLIPHAPNFAPIGGLALFSGSHFKKKIALAIPLIAMFLSDIFLGFHKTIPYVYLSFIIIALIGGLIKSNKWQSLLSASLISSVLFFLITNFGVWANGSMYQKNLNGLMQSYAFGIPFFRNTLISDLFYTFSFFYGYRFLSNFVFKKLLSKLHI
ncbi:MAG: hypothetical protein UR54_C0025G0016 [Candidatus Roizmanbacteria bacterium GW2011_GWA2_34_18]|uniref:Rod shape-determining protein MreD n=1 Tax=Candidatus Roizmanbacteria bacterium GW2011_GWA2_34_18 TaxID=1618477 RepID=A0A0G0AS32_9BACT|nr:MAG: hypothetical protein UR54_C0025G0016 [Candidatus Roizmanbacteria bacterium GW2011_GWA2_34_18]